MDHLAFIRARSPEAKAKRRMAILLATAEVLQKSGLEHTTLNAIAKSAGLAKSNIYRYFESREEILMRLLAEDLRKTNETIPKLLGQPRPLPEVASILSDTLAANPRLCLLLSITASTLEHNISTDTLRDIKRDMISSLEITATALHKALPELSVPQAINAVHIIVALVAGLWPLSAPGTALKALYCEPEFSDFEYEFSAMLRLSIETILKGLTT